MERTGGSADFESIDDLPCGVLMTDSKGLMLQANSTFCEWVGYRKEEIVAKRHLQEFFTVGGRIFYQTHLAPLLVMQGSVAEVKLDLQHRDGSTVPVVFNAKQSRSDGKWFLRIAAFIARDRDRYERELILSRKKVEAAAAEANRLKSESEDRALFAEQMIGIVSHDLRNPLAAIRLGVQALQKRGVLATQGEILSKMNRAADRAAQMIKDLLDFTSARIGSGLRVERAMMDLRQTTAHAVEELTLAYPGRRIHHIHSGSTMCSADANRIVQAIGNLVSNAVSYGDPDKDITVTSSVNESDWSVCVHNWGPPIAPEARNRLFSPMVRGVESGSSSRNVGLGLYIVNELVKAHGGVVEVTSTEELGTKFAICVPVAAAI